MSNLPTSTVQIQTEAVQYRAPVSESLLSNMGGAINFALTNLIPVGTIFPSMLTAAQFASINGTSNWALADGSAAPVGSTYRTLVSTTLPDLRGMYLRGKNNSRADGKQNPDGELALGAYQADQYASHTHGLTRVNISGSNGTKDVDNGSAKYNSDPALGSLSVDASGGNETRAKNVTVNYFIKIN